MRTPGERQRSPGNSPEAAVPVLDPPPRRAASADTSCGSSCPYERDRRRGTTRSPMPPARFKYCTDERPGKTGKVGLRSSLVGVPRLRRSCLQRSEGRQPPRGGSDFRAGAAGRRTRRPWQTFFDVLENLRTSQRSFFTRISQQVPERFQYLARQINRSAVSISSSRGRRSASLAGHVSSSRGKDTQADCTSSRNTYSLFTKMPIPSGRSKRINLK